MTPNPAQTPGTAGLSPRLALDYAGAESRLPLALLRDYPHVMERVNLLWPRADVVAYLDGLMLSTRPQRAGFSPEAMADIVFLKRLHDFRYPPGPEEIAADPFAPQYPRPKTVAELLAWGQREEMQRLKQIEDEIASPNRAPGWGELKTLEEVRAFLLVKSRGTDLLPPRRRLAEILEHFGVIAPEDVQAALQLQKEAPTRIALGAVLMRMKRISEYDLVKAMAMQAGHALVDLDGIPMAEEAASALDLRVASETRAVPLARVGKRLGVAVANPMTFIHGPRLAALTGCEIDLMWTPLAAIERRLGNYRPGRTHRLARA